MDVSEECTTGPRRKPTSDVQRKLYNFLNRSAHSLSRSNSQSGRSRRTEEHDIPHRDHDRDITPPPRTSHTAPRPPLASRNAPETSQARQPSSGRNPRKSSSPPATPSLPHTHPTSSTTRSNTSTAASPYNTPPQTPSRSRKHSNPSSPSSLRGDLLLTRPLARPITPSNSSSGRKVFGIPIPSPTSRKATLESENERTSPKRQSHKLRLGSNSSNEPLLHSRYPTTESDRSNVNVTPRPSTSAGAGTSTPTPKSTPQTHRSSEDRTPLPTPSSSLPRSHRSATSRDERELPPFPTTPATVSSRRGTSRLDFWRSITPRAPSSQGDRERGKQRTTTPSEGGGGKDEQYQGQDEPGSGLGLVSPQPRALATFLPSIPQFHRTPPPPQKKEEPEGQNTNTVRLDSFMSDSMPISQTAFRGRDGSGPGLTRQPTFKQSESGSGFPLRQAHTPGPGPGVERRPTTTTVSAPALGIQRSNSAPGSRGRLSPCLRIPSPKFLTRERSRSKENDKEKDREKSLGIGMYRGEKRRVTPESVGAPILREPRTPHVHPHGHTGEKTGPGTGLGTGTGVGVGVGGAGLKAPMTSLVQLRRAAHGTFDFERPGSRTSSKSGQSESRDGDEKENVSDKDRDRIRDRDWDWENERERERDYGRIAQLQGTRSSKSPEPIRAKLKASSPIPPLPTPRLLTKPRSPPPPPARTRSPLVASSPTATSHTHTHSQAHAQMHVDDSALPRLSSSIARRNSVSTNAHQHHRSHAVAHAHAHGYGHASRTPASLPHFSFEPAAAAAPSSATKPPREVGGQYVDTRTGLIMWAPKTPESEERRSDGGRRGASAATSAKANGHSTGGAAGGGIPQRELEEATVVITQFKNALDDAGFATLQKYVRRYDSKIIPLEGSAGLLTRIQRLLETSAPRVDERRKRELFENFQRVVSKVS